jgi:hypothetical protein
MKKDMKFSGSKMILLFVLAMASVNLFAQEKGTRQVQKQVSTEIEYMTLAKQLAQYGYEKELALPLLNAAQILIDISAGQLKVENTKRGEGNEGSKEAADISLDVTKLLADAESFSKNDKNVMGLVKSMRELTASSRGRVGGPGYVIDKVMAEQGNIHEVNFTGGEAAEVAVVGDGSTDLDLYIVDENGNMIAMDEGDTDECYVIWKPNWTGIFYITVVNRGTVYNQYALVTN